MCEEILGKLEAVTSEKNPLVGLARIFHTGWPRFFTSIPAFVGCGGSVQCVAFGRKNWYLDYKWSPGGQIPICMYGVACFLRGNGTNIIIRWIGNCQKFWFKSTFEIFVTTLLKHTLCWFLILEHNWQPLNISCSCVSSAAFLWFPGLCQSLSELCISTGFGCSVWVLDLWSMRFLSVWRRCAWSFGTVPLMKRSVLMSRWWADAVEDGGWSTMICHATI